MPGQKKQPPPGGAALEPPTPSKKKSKPSCFLNIKVFLVSECALMLAQGTVGAYLVSVLTTLERRFNLQSADVGVIASSFEIGNLALILFVSYFGAKGHRPRLIGCGGIVMALGALLSALPEFLTHQYEYESGEIRWGAEGRDVCAVNGSASDEGPDPDLICRNRTATNMMYLLLIGAQVLLGIGATPVQPLGVSYIDDHVRRKDSSLYIGAEEGFRCPIHSNEDREGYLGSSRRETLVSKDLPAEYHVTYREILASQMQKLYLAARKRSSLPSNNKKGDNISITKSHLRNDSATEYQHQQYCGTKM